MAGIIAQFVWNRLASARCPDRETLRVPSKQSLRAISRRSTISEFSIGAGEAPGISACSGIRWRTLGRDTVMKRHLGWLVAALALGAVCSAFVSSQDKAVEPRRNILIFVFDGLRAGSVNAVDSPTMFSIREHGVSFANSHSLFPTFTTANASAIATATTSATPATTAIRFTSGIPFFRTETLAARPAAMRLTSRTIVCWATSTRNSREII